MSTQPHYYRVGLFVLTAVALAAVGIIVFGSISLGPDRSVAAETYFEQSVQGLTVGSRVKMRGVDVGTVNEIAFVRDLYDVDTSGQSQFETWVVVRLSFESSLEGDRRVQAVADWLQHAIRRGLRLRLASAGVTGGKFVEADFLDPERFPVQEFPWQPRELYIPSAPGVFTEIVDAIDKFTQQMEHLDLAGITDELKAILQNIRKASEDDRMGDVFNKVDEILVDVQELLASPEVARTMEDLQGTLASSRSLMGKVDEAVDKEALRSAVDGMDDALVSLQRATDKLPDLVARLDQTLQRLQWLLSSDQPDLERTLVELRNVMRNLREITDTAKRYPSLLLFGEAPAPVDPGGKR